MGLHPPRIRYVKSTRYTVRPNDDVISIAGTFGMPPARWPELVGANPHKQLSDYGLRHKCFRSLNAGEPLNIPACWRNARPQGQVGAPWMNPSLTVDTLDLFKSAVRSVSTALGVPSHLMQEIDDLAEVVYSWWPYLKESVPNLQSTPPSTTPDLAGVVVNTITKNKWTALLQSANDFLAHYGMPSGGHPSVQNIPWADVPWSNLQDVWGNIPPSTWANVTSVLAGMPQSPSSQPPISLQLPPSGLPNFFDPHEWLKPMYANAPLAQTTWSDMLTEVLKDPRFVECNKTKADNFAKLKDCPQCYSNATEFVDLFCADGDPCDCAEASNGTDNQPRDTATQPDDSSTTDGSSKAMTYALIGTGVIGAVALISVLTSGNK